MSEIKFTMTIEYEGKKKTFRSSFPDILECKKVLFNLDPYEEYTNIMLAENTAAAHLAVMNILWKKMSDQDKKEAIFDWSKLEKYELDEEV